MIKTSEKKRWFRKTAIPFLLERHTPEMDATVNHLEDLIEKHNDIEGAEDLWRKISKLPLYEDDRLHEPGVHIEYGDVYIWDEEGEIVSWNSEELDDVDARVAAFNTIEAFYTEGPKKMRADLKGLVTK